MARVGASALRIRDAAAFDPAPVAAHNDAQPIALHVVRVPLSLRARVAPQAPVAAKIRAVR